MNCLKKQSAKSALGAALVLAVALLLVTGLRECAGETSVNVDPADAGTASNAMPADVTVELSSNQLDAIKVGPVGTYHFAAETEAVGTMSFDEDPAIVQAESTLLAAAGTVEVTSNELARVRSLYETNGVAQRELEQAASDDQTAEAALNAARAAVRALGKTDAEIDQMISSGAMNSGANGHGPTKWLVANVTESDSPFVREGQPVSARPMAFPDRKFTGHVAKIYGTLDPNLHHLQVRCEVDDPQDELRPGMLANVTIRLSDPVEATVVPANAVVREGDGTMTVWVTSDRQHFTQKMVAIGRREDGVVQILQELPNDKLLVTDGAIFLDNMVNAVPSD